MKIEGCTMWAMAHFRGRKPYIIGTLAARTRAEVIEMVEKQICQSWRSFSRQTGAKIIKVRVEAAS